MIVVHYSIPGGLALNFTIIHLPSGRRIWSYSDRLKGRLALPVSFVATHSADDANEVLITSAALLSTVVDGGIVNSSVLQAEGRCVGHFERNVYD